MGSKRAGAAKKQKETLFSHTSVQKLISTMNLPSHLQDLIRNGAHIEIIVDNAKPQGVKRRRGSNPSLSPRSLTKHEKAELRWDAIPQTAPMKIPGRGWQTCSPTPSYKTSLTHCQSMRQTTAASAKHLQALMNISALPLKVPQRRSSLEDMDSKISTADMIAKVLEEIDFNADEFQSDFEDKSDDEFCQCAPEQGSARTARIG
jgi:hypothetical protein